MTLPLRAVYRAREEFLSDGHLPASLATKVRPEVLTSWRRSWLSGAHSDAPTLEYQDDIVTDSPLCLAAEPVLAKLADRFSGLRAGVLLSDRTARIIRRWVAPDSAILLQMERIASTPGASGSEHFIGTNGIGTVAEERRARMIVGPEHYATSLSAFTCVGAPIHNPLTRKLEGIVTLNSDVESASPLLTPLMTSTAQEIEQRLLDLASLRERMLLDTFLTANRGGGSVAVVGEDVFMAGPRAARLLDGVDSSLLWPFVAEAVAMPRAGGGTRTILVPTATSAVAVRCSPLMVDGRLAGALLEVDQGAELGASPTTARVTRRPSPRSGGGTAVARAIPPPRAADDVVWPGRRLLPGQSAAWQNVLRAAARHRESDLPLLIVGESGSGKLAVARAMFEDASTGATPVRVADCVRSIEDPAGWLEATVALLSEDSAVVVLRHLDSLDAELAAALTAHVDAALCRPSGQRLVATAIDPDGWAVAPAQRGLLDRIAVARIELPALRQRRDDVRDLISQVAQRHEPGGAARFSSGALAAMTRAPWPGNIRQLESVVRGLSVLAASQEVTVDMLPSAIGQYSSRRALTTMEQLELDAIMSAVNEAQGNKVDAAKLLGISRSTLYRKMRSYRLDPDKHFY